MSAVFKSGILKSCLLESVHVKSDPLKSCRLKSDLTRSSGGIERKRYSASARFTSMKLFSSNSNHTRDTTKKKRKNPTLYASPTFFCTYNIFLSLIFSGLMQHYINSRLIRLCTSFRFTTGCWQRTYQSVLQLQLGHSGCHIGGFRH